VERGGEAWRRIRRARPRAMMASFVAVLRGRLRHPPADGRAGARVRNTLLTAVSAMLAKGTALAAMLLTVPLTLEYLGEEGFGLWTTISSLTALFLFADLGIGNGILNAVSHASGRDDAVAIRSAASSGFVMLSGIAVAALACCLAAWEHIDWAGWFNLGREDIARQAGVVALVVLVSFFLGLPLSVAGKVQAGLQRGYWTNLWEAAGSLMGLLGVWLAVRLDLGMTGVAAAFSLMPVLARGGNFLFYFFWRETELSPSLGYVSSGRIAALIRSGGLFFILQLSLSISMSLDNVVIASLLGAESVTEYSVVFRLFSIPSLLVGFVFMALWPAYGEAFARGDGEWIRRTLGHSLRYGYLVVVPVVAVFIAWGREIVSAWAGGGVEPGWGLLAGMGAWVLVSTYTYAVSVLLNGLHVVRFQVILAVVSAVVNLVLSVLLVRMVGVAGAIYGTVLALLTCVFIPYLLRVPRLLSSV